MEVLSHGKVRNKNTGEEGRIISTNRKFKDLGDFERENMVYFIELEKGGIAKWMADEIENVL
jgi:hypothetical protein